MENLHVSSHEIDNICNCNRATPDAREKLDKISLEDQIARSIHDIFDSLPAKCKPRTSADGVSEWIPLSGIAIVRDGSIKCVALGTGMKCLPANQTTLLNSGTVLHDWHAEILAIRAFNHFLLQEAHSLASTPTYVSRILRRTNTHESSSQSSKAQPYAIHSDLQIMMYCSTAPCGDASMELIMESQSDATPWPVLPPDEESGKRQQPLLGRGSFSQLGIVRRKPSRPDAPPTLSKSCSDKLALKQCTSILSSLTALLISPTNAYITTLILPTSQYRPAACSRSFGPEGRMKPLVTQNRNIWNEGYAYNPFSVKTTEIEFAYSRDHVPKEGGKSCNISAVWAPGIQETLINGVLQGRKQMDPKGASKLSRSGMWELWKEINRIVGGGSVVPVDISYEGMKELDALASRRQVKEETKKMALKGWDG